MVISSTARSLARKARLQNALADRPVRLGAKRKWPSTRAWVLRGDFNVAPEDRDSYDPVGLKDTIHYTVEERGHLHDLLKLGLTDAFRMFDQPEKSYSWWDYRMLILQKPGPAH